MISDPQELFRFLATPNIEMTNLLFATGEVVWVTNEVIGFYVTTGARPKLYSYLDVLKERAMYCDTDSVIYVQKCGQPPAVSCGDKLGDMTNELGCDEHIEEFVSVGSKN